MVRFQISSSVNIPFFSLLSTYLQASHGFVTPTQFAVGNTVDYASSTLWLGEGWEDVIYNAQSAATNLAGISLKEASFSSFPLMYGAGLLASVSPCVWGLLPLTMSYISTAAGEREDKDATLPTVAFAGGLGFVFCSLGLLAASLGGGLYGRQDALTGLIISVLTSGICLLMGLQLLEFIDLPLPSFEFDVLTSEKEEAMSTMENSSEIRFDKDGNMLPPETSIQEAQSKSKNRGSLFRTFLLGGSSALVSSPCATPVLTSILAFVSKANDPFLGAFLLLGYTVGYSTPLLLVAASGGQILTNLSAREDSVYGKVAPWITPLTGGILLWYGINGLLAAVFGDPSMVALAPVLE